MVTAANRGQEVALQMGWNGAGQGAGGHTAWVNGLNPAQRAQYDASIGGNATAAPTQSMPLFQELLHPYEQQGLTGLTAGVNTTRMADILSQLRQTIGDNTGQAGNLVANGTAAVTPEEVAKVQNPFSSSLKTQLSTDAQKIRAAATASQGLRGGRSFGDTATGTQMGLIDQQQLQGDSDIDYKTWQDALGQINGEKNRMLTGAGTVNDTTRAATSGAGTAFDSAKYLSELPFETARRRLGAGSYLRDYNQGIDDTMKSDILAEQDAPYKKLQQTLDLLKGFMSNTSTGGTAAPTSGLETAGGIANVLSGLLSKGGGVSNDYSNTNSLATAGSAISALSL